MVVTDKFYSDPIHLAWMVKKVGELARNANKPRPRPACQGGESGWKAKATSAPPQDPALLVRAVNEAERWRTPPRFVLHSDPCTERDPSDFRCDRTTSFTTSTSEVGSRTFRSGCVSCLALFTALASRAGSNNTIARRGTRTTPKRQHHRIRVLAVYPRPLSKRQKGAF